MDCRIHVEARINRGTTVVRSNSTNYCNGRQQFVKVTMSVYFTFNKTAVYTFFYIQCLIISFPEAAKNEFTKLSKYEGL